MSVNRQTEKWITAGLGLVALVLVVGLVFRGKPGVGGSKSATPAPPPHAMASPDQSPELARFDPALQLEKFKAVQDRPAPKLKRNPFEFVTREVAAAPAPSGPAPAPIPQAPAAPPPPPLKAVGYTQMAAGAEAFVTLQEELFVVHEGESFAKRFKVIKLSPSAVEIFDETTQQTIRLPIAN